MAERRGIWAALALALSLTTCGDDQPFECTKPAECVGRPSGNDCKKVKSKGKCVIACQPVTSGSDGCPPTAHCTGVADDGTSFCAY